jgi:predicted DnaQ family exonuclease/DinG family helicase
MEDIEADFRQTGEAFVSLDLETTGLDSTLDRIIEIGAVKFRGEEVLDTFHSLVNPYCPLPHRVRWLTGITPQELQDAPPFAAIAPDLSSFLEGCPIVGQNIGFDVSFLSAQGLEVSGPLYDTLELARIMLSDLPDYTLSTLAEQLGIETSAHHRALDDAMTARGVFLALIDRASCLHPEVIGEILRLTANTGWVWHSILASLGNSERPPASYGEEGRFGIAMTSDVEPLVPKTDIESLDIDQLTQFLSEDGAMSGSFPLFEYRPGQVSMMQAVAHVMNAGGILLAEAGTGIGKSVAYLLPAILFAVQNGTHVVVSTNTINLQDQLVHKDIPDLLRVLNLPESPQVAQLKGRSNYLCLKQWNSRRQTPGLSWEETGFLLRLTVWLSSTSTGDRAELNLRRDDMSFWDRVSASEQNCTPNACPYRGGCYLYNARRRAEGSHIVVVNHSLLLSDLVNASKVLPEYRHLVIDEAHHLEEEATEQLGYEVSRWDFYSFLDHLGERNGVLVDLVNRLQRKAVSRQEGRETEELAAGLLEQVRAARQQVSSFFDHLVLFLQDNVAGGGRYEQHLRLVGDVRRQQDWQRVEALWGGIHPQLWDIESNLMSLCSMMEDLSDEDGRELSSVLEDILASKQAGQKLRERINSIMTDPEENRIDWLSLREQQEAILRAAPLRVGEALDELLFSQTDCVVLTSATLSAAGSFEYTKECLGLAEVDELLVESPFDYRKAALVYLPLDIPEPRDARYQPIVGHALLELCRATQGRALILFTSHASLRATYAVLQPELEEEDTLVLGQGIDGSPKQLLKMLRANPRTVLLGTASLWEGIDVVGAALSVVVMSKLPFNVPSDPVFSARSELFDDSFAQYAVPQAILRFKQGFGRLIRSRNDHGAMVLLDSRLQTKRYGETFLESLPVCTIVKAPLRQMPGEVERWLAEAGPPRASN